MHYRRYHGTRKPLSPRQRVWAIRGAVGLLLMCLLGLAMEDIFAPPPAYSVAATRDCMKAGYVQAICVDVTRSTGDYRY